MNTNLCICAYCKKSYIYVRSKGGTMKKCNSCHVNERRFKLKKRCIEYLGGKCSICNYNKCITSLSFHHKDPSQKDFNISGAHSKSWAKIENELNKCILLCLNCHTELHAIEHQKLRDSIGNPLKY